jgi:hypothetical protein
LEYAADEHAALAAAPAEFSDAALDVDEHEITVRVRNIDAEIGKGPSRVQQRLAVTAPLLRQVVLIGERCQGRVHAEHVHSIPEFPPSHLFERLRPAHGITDA